MSEIKFIADMRKLQSSSTAYQIQNSIFKKKLKTIFLAYYLNSWKKNSKSALFCELLKFSTNSSKFSSSVTFKR